MSFKFKKQTGSDGAMGDNIFIDKVTINAINNISGKTTDFQTEARDLAIEVTFGYEKNDWTRTMNISGNFKRDEQGMIVGLGAAFKVMNFFLDIGAATEEDQLEEDNSIPKHILAKSLGKKCWLLSYKNTNGKFSSWNQVANPDTEKQDFKDYFLQQYKKTGYPRNYDGNTDTGTDFNFGANIKEDDIPTPVESVSGLM